MRQFALVLAVGMAVPTIASAQAVAIDGQTTDGTSSISRLQIYTTTSVGAVGQISILQSRLKFGSAGYLNVDSAVATAPSAGDLRYDSAGSTLQFYTTAWQTVVTGGNAAYVQSQSAADQSASFRITGTGTAIDSVRPQAQVANTSTTDKTVALRGLTSSSAVETGDFYGLYGESNLGDTFVSTASVWTFNSGVYGKASGTTATSASDTLTWNMGVNGVASGGPGTNANNKVGNVGILGLAGLASPTLPSFAQLGQTTNMAVRGEAAGAGSTGGSFYAKGRALDAYLVFDTAWSGSEISGVRSYAETDQTSATIYGVYAKAQDKTGSTATGETYYGMYAEARVGQTANYGVWARAEGGTVGGANQGLHAECYGNTAAASTNYGIYATCSGNFAGSTSYGIRADVSGSGTLWSGYFAGGSVAVTSTTNQLVLGTTNTVTINAAAPAASRTYTIPDAGANDSFVLLAATQTLTSKTWNGATIGVGYGGTGQSASLTQGGVIYGASTTAMGSSAAGTSGDVLTSGGTGTPTWTTPGGGVLIAFQSTAAFAGSQTIYYGGPTAYSTIAPAEIVMPKCVVKRIRVYATTNSLNSNSTLTLYKAGVATTMTVTITAATTGAFSTVTNPVTFVDGDLLGVEIALGGTAGQSLYIKTIVVDYALF